MPPIEARTEVAVGLVHQAGDLHTHLSDALRGLGARVVYEVETAKFDRAELDRSGAQVVIVNLDPDADEQVDAIDDLLVDDSLKVVFNDGEVTSKLSGYDLARWARHLAAKIVGDVDLLPPRPAGAEAVPVRNMPQHALTTSDKPRSMDAPSVTDESMHDATDAIAGALASFDLHATKLESKNAEPPAVSATDINALLGDFGLSDPPDAEPDASANPFTDLGFALEVPASAVSVAAVDDPVAVRSADTPNQSHGKPSDGDVNPFADLGLELDVLTVPDPAVPVDDPVPAEDLAASVEAADPLSGEDAHPFGDLGFNLDFDKVPSRPIDAAAVGGIDELLAQQSAATAAPDKVKTEARPGYAGKSSDAPAVLGQATVRTSIPKSEDFALDLSDPVLPPTPRDAPKPTDTPAFSFNIDHLSLEPTAEERGPDDPFADRGMASESVLHGARASEKVASGAPAAPAPVPKVSAPPSTVSEDDQFSFSLDDTVELSFETPIVELASSGQEEDDFMREFAALTEGAGRVDSDSPPAANSGAPTRVWVLGASIGGPDAVREFLADIPPGIGATFVLAQHMGADFVDLMVAQLQKATRLPVAIASSGVHVGDGRVLVVPIAERMLLETSGEVNVVALDDVSPYSPSIDRVLIDVGDRFGGSSGAIIFSGMAHDAIEGAKHLAGKGGQVWAQDPSTCVVSSMIDGAMEAGIVSYVGAPAALAAEFVRRYGKS